MIEEYCFRGLCEQEGFAITNSKDLERQIADGIGKGEI